MTKSTMQRNGIGVWAVLLVAACVVLAAAPDSEPEGGGPPLVARAKTEEYIRASEIRLRVDQALFSPEMVAEAKGGLYVEYISDGSEKFRVELKDEAGSVFHTIIGNEEVFYTGGRYAWSHDVLELFLSSSQAYYQWAEAGRFYAQMLPYILVVQHVFPLTQREPVSWHDYMILNEQLQLAQRVPLPEDPDVVAVDYRGLAVMDRKVLYDTANGNMPVEITQYARDGRPRYVYRYAHGVEIAHRFFVPRTCGYTLFDTPIRSQTTLESIVLNPATDPALFAIPEGLTPVAPGVPDFERRRIALRVSMAVGLILLAGGFIFARSKGFGRKQTPDG